MSRSDLDAVKLYALADWFDEQDRKPGARATGDEVQQDLRRIAGYLSTHVVISPDRHKQLIEDQAKLDALEQAGVDNWEWYGEAMRTLAADEDE